VIDIVLLDEYAQEMALRRLTKDQDIAKAVSFLVADESRRMAGHDVIVDGGRDVWGSVP